MTFGNWEYDLIMDEIEDVFTEQRTDVRTVVEVQERIIRELTDRNKVLREYEG